MSEHETVEWWLWQINRRVAEFVSRPCERSETALNETLSAYRRLREQARNDVPTDEHEWALNYR